MTQVYHIVGDIGSPYSMKMRAILRYRRLPFIWSQLNQKLREEIAHVKPPVISEKHACCYFSAALPAFLAGPASIS